MSKTKRAIFFWSLAAIFLITAPVVVLHAHGYRFDFTRGVFVYSGTITFKTNPPNVDITLNGKLNESKKLDRINSSYNVSGLLPGYYTIEISAPGFQTWKKAADVHSGLSSEFWNVVLARKVYEQTDYAIPKINKFFTSPGNKYLAFSEQQDDTLMVKILNINDKTVENSFSFQL